MDANWAAGWRWASVLAILAGSAAPARAGFTIPGPSG